MLVRLAEKCGFCFGVKRAISLAEGNRGAFTFGEIIHNSRETDRLQSSFNVAIANGIEDIGENSKVIIRTHGIERDSLAKLKVRAREIIDATCPFVKKPQKIAEKMSAEGYQVIIFGDAKHPEVKGVLSYASSGSDRAAAVVSSEEELLGIKIGDRVALISQTTKEVEDFNKVAAALIKIAAETRVFNTICNATSENQEATKNLAKEVDIMVIVGGKNSSNTKELRKISAYFCPESYLIESAEELDAANFAGKKICGISAGASTPDWIIAEVAEKIKSF